MSKNCDFSYSSNELCPFTYTRKSRLFDHAKMIVGVLAVLLLNTLIIQNVSINDKNVTRI